MHLTNLTPGKRGRRRLPRLRPFRPRKAERRGAFAGRRSGKDRESGHQRRRIGEGG